MTMNAEAIPSLWGAPTVLAVALGLLVLLASRLAPRPKPDRRPLPPEGCAFTELFPDGLKAQAQAGLVAKYGTVFTVPSPLPGIVPNQVVIAEPELAKELCVRQANMYRDPSNFTTRGDAFARATRDVVGEGVTGLKGEEWRWRKQALLKEFHRNRLLADERGLLQVVIDEGKVLCDELGKAADAGEEVQVDVLATKAAVGVVLFFLFGRRLDFDTDALRTSAKDLIDALFQQLVNPLFHLAKHIPGTGARATYKKMKAAQKVVDDVVATELDLLLEEYHSGKAHPDRTPGSVMASLIANEARFRDRGTEAMLAEARVFVQAGFETTAHSLAFAFGMLAERPDLADEMARRGKEHFKSKESRFDVDEMKAAIEEVSIVNGFFHEALRLYPLAPSLGGECTNDIDVTTEAGEQYTLPKGTSVLFLNFPLQRRVSDPEEIMPERWDVQPSERPFLHTFQNGPHSCPGKPLSLLEGRVCLMLAAMEFTFEFPGERKMVEYVDNVLLRPKDGMPLLVKRR